MTTSPNQILSAASAFGQAWVEEFARELEKKGVDIDVLTSTLNEFKTKIRGAVAGGGKPAAAVKKPRAKRALSLYNMFMKEKLKALSEANPGMQKKDVMRLASQQWSQEKDSYKGPVVAV